MEYSYLCESIVEDIIYQMIFSVLSSFLDISLSGYLEYFRRSCRIRNIERLLYVFSIDLNFLNLSILL